MPAQFKFFVFLIAMMAIFLFSLAEVLATIEFTVSNAVVTNDEIDINVSISGLTSSSCFENRCYLQGTLKAEDGTKYFGFTQNNNGEWFEYISSPEVEYIRSTFFYFEPDEGNWSGKLKLKNNPEDMNYKGPGDYSLKLRRYSGESKSYAGESNTLTVNLVSFIPSPTPSPSPTFLPSPSPTSASSPTSSPTPSLTPSPKPIKVTGATLLGKVLGEEGSTPAGFYPWEATGGAESQEATGASRVKFVPKLFLGLGLVFLVVSGLYLWFTQRAQLK